MGNGDDDFKSIFTAICCENERERLKKGERKELKLFSVNNFNPPSFLPSGSVKKKAGPFKIS